MQELPLKKVKDLCEKIGEIDEKIEVIETRLYSPKNQIISDMPRGNGRSNDTLDRALTKLDTLRDTRKFYYDRLVSAWLICEKVFNSCDISDKHVKMFKYRYFNGLAWRKVLRRMEKDYPNEPWNENKIFRMYRQVIALCTNERVIIC